MSKPNNTPYLANGKGKYAIYTFFTQEEIDVIIAAAGPKNAARFIQELVLEHLGLNNSKDNV